MPSYGEFRPSLRFQSTLSLSKDGKRLAYADDAAGQFNLTIESVSGGTPLRLTSYTDQTVRRVVWHPDGDSLIFQADAQGNESAQIYRMSAGGGDAQPLTETPGTWYWLALGEPFSPDGGRLAYVGNDRDPRNQDVLIRDLETDRVDRVYVDGGQVYVGYWSPDGSRINMARYRDGYDHVVYVQPTDGRPAKRLTSAEETAAYGLGPWLPDGSGFLVRTNAGREFTGLAVMEAETGELTWLDTPDWDVESLALSADGRILVWTVNVDGASQLRARNLATGLDLVVPQLPQGQAEALSISRDGSFAVMLLSTASVPRNIATIDFATSEFRWLTESRPEAATAMFAEPELVRYRSQDGLEISGYLYRPAETQQRTGVVLSIHGGPVYQERPIYAHDGFYQYLASRGVAVFAPNVRGSSGYGKTFQKLVYRDWGGGDLEDFHAAARYLQELDWVDPVRIGLFGGSYGAFGVLSCLARLPEINWAAGVDMFGPSNLVTLGLATPPAFRSIVVDVIGDPETDAEFLLSRSPITYSDQIRAPLFVIQGANDPRVPQGESDQLVERLRAHGVEVRYDVYPDEGHGFTKTVNQTKARSDAAEFLIAHLT